jgi:hypothetical protein
MKHNGLIVIILISSGQLLRKKLLRKKQPVFTLTKRYSGICLIVRNQELIRTCQN